MSCLSIFSESEFLCIVLSNGLTMINFNWILIFNLTEAEKDEEGRMDIMFDRLMLMELRENVSRLDPFSFAELKSYKEPPQVIHDILRATLALFNVDKAGCGGFDDWSTVKNVSIREVCEIIILGEFSDNHLNIVNVCISVYLAPFLLSWDDKISLARYAQDIKKK